MANPNDFFLDEAQSGSDTLFRAARRDGVTVTPLVDGIVTFQAMERAIAKATKTVHMAAWILNPDVPLQAGGDVAAALKARGVTAPPKNWGELLAAVAGLGVEVCILLSDFDPLLQREMHAMTWSSYRRLQAAALAKGKGHMQTLVSLHPHQVTGFLVTLAAGQRKTDIIAWLNGKSRADAARAFDDLPRLWDTVQLNANGKYGSKAGVTAVWPVSHHQKICIVDRLTGFCGGIDVQTGRVDAKESHAKGWHDTHCQVDGLLAADLDRNFVGRWNAEMADFNAFIAAAAAQVAKRATPATAITMPTGAVPPTTGPAKGQLIRTVTEAWAGRDLPSLERDDLLLAYQQAIGLAEQFVYIENQYVRDIRLANWLIARAQAVPALVVILVLPIAPEEVRNPPRDTDDGTKKGLDLQHTVLTTLIAALGARFRLYSMLQRLESADPSHPTNYLSSAQVYVHSKAMIVDDVWATIGSANTNPRSFRVDTEANIHWVDPAGVKRLRLDLWKEMLGSPPGIETWTPGQFIARWDAIANANKTAKPTARKGYVVPHDPENLRDARAPNRLVPDQYCELGELAPDNDALA